MKPHPLTDCLLRLTDAAHLAVYSLYLMARPRGLMPIGERLAEATLWQSERLFWARTYHALMGPLLSESAVS